MKFSILMGTSGQIIKEHACSSNESEYDFAIGTFSNDCVLEIFSFTGTVCLRHDRVKIYCMIDPNFGLKILIINSGSRCILR